MSTHPEPRYSDATMRTFEFFFHRWRSRRLRIVMLDEAPALPADVPLVLVANHTSWWDGFLLRDVQRALRPRRPLFSVMTARELRRNPFLRRIGAVPLEQGSAGSMLALLRSLQLEAHRDPSLAVSFFPQGRITPAWQRPLGFERGVELLVRALSPCCVLPVALHIEPLNHARPTAFVGLGAPLHTDGGSISARRLERVVQNRLDDIAAALVRGAPLMPAHAEHA
jgi:1-acyl-sn-glycerol-3-phosphate acyltransferase